MAITKTAALKGAALDWAVAAALEVQFGEHRVVKVCRVEATTPAWIELENGIGACMYHRFYPSTDWAQGGPIIERELIDIQAKYNSGSDIVPKGQWYWQASTVNQDDVAYWFDAPTPLIAAMRCYVASKLGDELDVPAELCE